MIRRGCNCGRFPVGPEPFRTVRSVSICCTARRIGFHQFRPLPDTSRLGLFCAPRGHVLEGRSQVAELVQRRHYGELLNVMLGRLGVSQSLPKGASGYVAVGETIGHDRGSRRPPETRVYQGAHLRLALIEAPCRFDPVDFPPPQTTVRREARGRSCLPVCRSACLPACLPEPMLPMRRPAASG